MYLHYTYILETRFVNISPVIVPLSSTLSKIDAEETSRLQHRQHHSSLDIHIYNCHSSQDLIVMDDDLCSAFLLLRVVPHCHKCLAQQFMPFSPSPCRNPLSPSVSARVRVYVWMLTACVNEVVFLVFGGTHQRIFIQNVCNSIGRNLILYFPI